MSNTQKRKPEAIALIGQQIRFVRLAEEEYCEVYYDRMKSVGWKPIVDSTTAHSILARNGLFGLKYNDTIIASISAAKYPALSIAYIGFYTVDENWRHAGLGRYLWKQVASILESEGHTIEFDSPPELVPYYTSLGYKEFSSMTIRELRDRSQITLNPPSENVQPIDKINLSTVIDFDQKILPDSKRSEFLPLWFNKKDTTSVAYIKDDIVLGYGVISKQLVDGYSAPYSYIIAPVYATTPEVSIAIIRSLCLSANPNEPIYMDTLDCHTTAVTVANSLGFEAIFPAHRLSSTGKLDSKREAVMSQVYAISSHGYAPL